MLGTVATNDVDMHTHVGSPELFSTGLDGTGLDWTGAEIWFDHGSSGHGWQRERTGGRSRGSIDGGW
nr:hypothetical protein CFP56_66492 [Quercus suber]